MVVVSFVGRQAARRPFDDDASVAGAVALAGSGHQ